MCVCIELVALQKRGITVPLWHFSNLKLSLIAVNPSMGEIEVAAMPNFCLRGLYWVRGRLLIWEMVHWEKLNTSFPSAKALLSFSFSFLYFS